MKGLLLKDVYMMASEVKYLILLAAIVLFLQNDWLFIFFILYASALPITSLAYDEQAKWKNLADMLPFTPQQVFIRLYFSRRRNIGCFSVKRHWPRRRMGRRAYDAGWRCALHFYSDRGGSVSADVRDRSGKRPPFVYTVYSRFIKFIIFGGGSDRGNSVFLWNRILG